MDLTPLLPGPAQASTFALAVLVLNATPGVDFVLTVSRTLQGGARAGLAAALGINAGCVLHALAAAFGLAALLVLHPPAFVALQWAGAAYLVWLGVGLLRLAWWTPAVAPTGFGASAAASAAMAAASASPSGPAGPPAGGAAQAPMRPPGRQRARRSGWADFRSGLLTNVLNPKVALFFLAFLPPFVPAASPSKTLSFLLLGGWFVLQSLVFSGLLVALAARLAHLQAPGTVQRALQALGGVVFIALALRLLKERSVPA